MANDKAATERIEGCELEVAKACEDDGTPKPAALESLSDEELRKLGVRTTMKLDLIVMPALTIMYILNYLGMLTMDKAIFKGAV